MESFKRTTSLLLFLLINKNNIFLLLINNAESRINTGFLKKDVYYFGTRKLLIWNKMTTLMEQEGY